MKKCGNYKKSFMRREEEKKNKNAKSQKKGSREIEKEIRRVNTVKAGVFYWSALLSD